MVLNCIINGNEFNDVIPQGSTYIDEYNEVLDSGVLMLGQITRLNAKPGDIVYIFNDEKTYEKYFAIDDIEGERVNIDEKLWNYTIKLCSETKLLEKIPCPNLNITSGKERTIWDYLNIYVNFYSPKIRVVDGGSWKYTNKYVLDDTCGFYTRRDDISSFTTFKNYFSSKICPELSWNNPNLREVLTKLTQVVDCLPIVHKNKIQFINIGLPNGKFVYDKKYINDYKVSYTSDGYCDKISLDLNQGLDLNEEGLLTRNVEYIGFRNNDKAIISLEEGTSDVITKNPIYQINSLSFVIPAIVAYQVEWNTGETEVILTRTMLEWDISPLILLNEKRNILSEDMITDGWKPVYDDSNKITEWVPSSGSMALNEDSPWDIIIKYAQQYKFSTLGYSIGSNVISGWSDMWEQTTGYWFWCHQEQYSVIEGIVETAINKCPLGTKLNYEKITQILENNDTKGRKVNNITDAETGLLFTGNNWFNSITMYDLLLFKIDYYSLKSSKILFSKKGRNGFITQIDNPSSSISNISSLGLLEYNKIDRLGNPLYLCTARYDNFNQMNPVGSNYIDENGDNIIFYHREYAIYDNFILVKYVGTKDYILQNYFTSINAKLRPWQIASIDSSVKRKDNRTLYVEFSKNKYKDKTLFTLSNNIYESILSPLNANMQGLASNELTTGYIITDDTYSSKLECEITIAKTALCFSFNLNDNVSNGTYISNGLERMNLLNIGSGNYRDRLKKGLYQEWVKYAPEGWLTKIRVGIYHVNENFKTVPYLKEYKDLTDMSELFKDMLTGGKETNELFEKIYSIPLFDFKNDLEFLNKDSYIEYNFENYYKDNKEIPCITLELEAVSDDGDIRIGEAFWKCSNLVKSDRTFSTYTDKIMGFYQYEENLDVNVLGNDLKSSGYFTVVDLWVQKLDAPSVQSTVSIYLDADKLYAIWKLTETFTSLSLTITGNYDVIDSVSQDYITTGTFNSLRVEGPFTIRWDSASSATGGTLYLTMNDPYISKQPRLDRNGTNNWDTTFAVNAEWAVNGDKRPVGQMTTEQRESFKIGLNYAILVVEDVATNLKENIMNKTFIASMTIKDNKTNKTYYMRYREGSVSGLTGNQLLKFILEDTTDTTKTITFTQIPRDDDEMQLDNAVYNNIYGFVNFSNDVSIIGQFKLRYGMSYVEGSGDDDEPAVHEQNMFICLSEHTYNKYEINKDGTLGTLQQSLKVNDLITVDNSSHSINIAWDKVNSNINFIGVFHKKENYYELVFGVNRNAGNKIYVSLKDSINNYVYESQLKQNIVGDIGDSDSIINTGYYSNFKKIY